MTTWLVVTWDEGVMSRHSTKREAMESVRNRLMDDNPDSWKAETGLYLVEGRYWVGRREVLQDEGFEV